MNVLIGLNTDSSEDKVRMLIFRILVLIDLIIMIQSCFQEPLEPTKFIDQNSAILLGLISLSLLAGYFISILGLLMTKNWGRRLYLIVNVVGVIITYELYGDQALPFISPDPLINLSGAVTVALLYLSQVRQRKMFV